MDCRYQLVEGNIRIELPDYFGIAPTIIYGNFTLPSGPISQELKKNLVCGNFPLKYPSPTSEQDIWNAALEKGRNPLLYHRTKIESGFWKVYRPFYSYPPNDFADWAIPFLETYKNVWMDPDIYYDWYLNVMPDYPELLWQGWASYKLPMLSPVLTSPLIARIDDTCGLANLWFSKLKNWQNEYMYLSGNPHIDIYPYFDPNENFQVCFARFRPDFRTIDCYANGSKFAVGSCEIKIL